MQLRGWAFKIGRLVVSWGVLSVAVRMGTGLVGDPMSWSTDAALCAGLVLPSSLIPERFYRVSRRIPTARDVDDQGATDR